MRIPTPFGSWTIGLTAERRPAPPDPATRMAIAGLLAGIAAMVLFFIPYLGTFLGGLVYGVVIYRSLAVRRSFRGGSMVALAGGIGFFLAFATAMGLPRLVVGHAVGGGEGDWLRLVSFPLGGLLGSTAFAVALRAAAVPIGGRTLARFVLVGTVAGYLPMILNVLGIPAWQSVTAYVLGVGTSTESAARAVPRPPR